MTRAEFEMFLLGSAILCLVMALFNVFRAKSRGVSGYLLSCAFLAVAGALMLYRAGTDTSFVIAIGGIAFILLVADFMIRAKNQVIGGSKK
jgi:hypothetical protein